MSVTLNGTSGLVFSDGTIQGTAGAMAFRNRIINGDMRIDQRNNGAAVTPTNGQYIVDRWFANVTHTVGLFSVQQNAGAVAPPVGFVNYLGVTSLSSASLTAGESYSVRQTIEGFNIADLGWGSATAAPVTLSFWVRSSLTGTFGGSLRNGAANRSYPYTYIITSANTWEYKTVIIEGDTTGTWLTTNGAGITIMFNLGSSSTFSGTADAWVSANLIAPTGATSVVGTNGATWQVTGVQLEKAGAATSFEHRPIGTELAMCQRYFELLGNGAAGGSSTNPLGNQLCWHFAVEKRAIPSLQHLSNYNCIIPGQANFTATNTTAGFMSTSGVTAGVTTSTAPSATGLAFLYADSGTRRVAVIAEL